jgi:Protein of unknown function (DUF2786)
MAKSTAGLDPALSPELERLALLALAEDYDQFNYALFSNKLKRPQLRMIDGAARLGLWEHSSRMLSISRDLLLKHNWGVVLEVLKHEMAHQFVTEVLSATDERAHGPLFQRVCAERGIDARAAGVSTSETGAEVHVISKIARLLSLAQSGNQHEAQAAMAAAQRLMLKYNVEAVANAAERDFVFAHLGQATGRVDESQRVLAAILSEFFFVQVLWVSVWRPLEAKRGTVLEVCGTKANVELAEYVHGFLTHSAEHLWTVHRVQQGLQGNAERRRYIAGVMSGFYKKLSQQREPAREEGLVWLGDPQLTAHFKRRYPRTRQVSYATSSGSAAHAEGRRAGEKLVLHRGVSQGGTGAPRLLKGR